MEYFEVLSALLSKCEYLLHSQKIIQLNLACY